MAPSPDLLQIQPWTRVDTTRARVGSRAHPGVFKPALPTPRQGRSHIARRVAGDGSLSPSFVLLTRRRIPSCSPPAISQSETKHRSNLEVGQRIGSERGGRGIPYS